MFGRTAVVLLKVRHTVTHASLIAVALLCLLLVEHWSAQADSASTPSVGIAGVIFGDRDRFPIDIARKVDGSIVLVSGFFNGHSTRDQFVVHRLDAEGRVIWRTLLSARDDVPKHGPTIATSGFEYGDEASLLALWELSSSDEDLLDTYLVASADVEGGPIIVADRLLGLWALSGDGRILWHRHLFEPLGLSLLTALVLSDDGSLLLGGLGGPVGGRCAAAIVMKLDSDGQLVWQWRSDHELLAYAARVVSLAGGGVAVLVDSPNPNRYLAGIGETPCSPFRANYRRLVWLDRSGHQTHQIDVPARTYIEGMTTLSDRSIAIIGWQTGALLFRRLSADGKRLLGNRVYDLHRLFGWSKEISPWYVDITAVAGADIVFVATFYCPNEVWPCLGRGVHAVEFAPDGRLRRMPDRVFKHPLLATRDYLSHTVLIFTPEGVERIPPP